MNKLITALDNNFINNKLKELNKYEIKYDDISYQEGVLELLQNEKFDFLLLSEKLKGPYIIEELIEKIKVINNKIEIIMILDKKNEFLEKFLIKNNINNYFYNNELTYEEFKNKKFIKKELNKNIDEIKNIILKSKINIKKAKDNNGSEKKSNILLSICGKSSIEKSIFCINFSLMLKNKKTLIMDFDIIENNLNALFGVEKFPNKNLKEKNIIKINKNTDLFFDIEFILNNDVKNIYDKIEELKNKYDYILINLSPIFNMKLSKKIINNSQKCIFVFDEKNDDINFNNNLLNIYINEWGIKKEKFISLLNKIKKENYFHKVLKNIINNKNLGNKEYFLILNANIKKVMLNKFLKKEYKEIEKIVNK